MTSSMVENRDDKAQKEPEDYFAPGTASERKHAVLYQGEFETPSDGTAVAVRLHARALAAAGLPVVLRSFSSVVVNKDGVAEPVYVAGMPEEVQVEVGHLLNVQTASFLPLIKHVVIRSPEHVRQIIMPRGAVPIDPDDPEQMIATRDHIYGSTIVYSVWERDRIDPGVARHLARVKQCWVPCRQNAQLLVESGVPADRVHVVPHPYDPSDLVCRLTQRKPDLHDGYRRFYSVGRWEPRKGFDALIGAFLEAFEPGGKESLTIKYSGVGQWQGYPTPKESIAYWQQRYQQKGWTMQRVLDQVKILSGRLSRSMLIKRTHFDGNIYVSASHGEAWNLPAFESALAGNGLVYVGWGGVCDFAPEGAIQVPHVLGDAHPSYRWEHGAQWATYTLDALAEGLRRAKAPESFERPAGFEERFGIAAVGQQMKQLVQLAVRGRPELEATYA
jgi:glycosyltransferase involved in cell wall biosynthesis